MAHIPFFHRRPPTVNYCNHGATHPGQACKNSSRHEGPRRRSEAHTRFLLTVTDRYTRFLFFFVHTRRGHPLHSALSWRRRPLGGAACKLHSTRSACVTLVCHSCVTRREHGRLERAHVARARERVRRRLAQLVAHLRVDIRVLLVAVVEEASCSDHEMITLWFKSSRSSSRESVE